MSTKKILCVSALFLSTASLASDQLVGVEHGLWHVVSTISVEGQGIVKQDDNNECISPAEAKRTVESFVDDFLGESDQCTVDKLDHSEGQAKVEATCYEPEDELTAKGVIEVVYTPTTYNVKGRATLLSPLGETKLTSTVDAKRLGDCK